MLEVFCFRGWKSPQGLYNRSSLFKQPETMHQHCEGGGSFPTSRRLSGVLLWTQQFVHKIFGSEKHRQTRAHTQRHRDTQTNRHTDTQTHTHTHTHPHRTTKHITKNLPGLFRYFLAIFFVCFPLPRKTTGPQKRHNYEPLFGPRSVLGQSRQNVNA